MYRMLQYNWPHTGLGLGNGHLQLLERTDASRTGEYILYEVYVETGDRCTPDTRASA